MELIRTQLELLNGDDLALVRRNKLPVEDVRKMNVTALVDCGAMMLAINENICQQLGLMKVEERLAELADGTILNCDVVGPIEVRIPHRRCSVDAMVLPGESEVLLGAIPMEDMDLVIHPKLPTVQVNPAMPYISKKPMK